MTCASSAHIAPLGRVQKKRDLGIGNWGQLGQGTGTGNWEQGTGGIKLGTGLGTGNWGQGPGGNWGRGKLRQGIANDPGLCRLSKNRKKQFHGGATLRRRERVLLVAQVELWAGGGRMLDERVRL